MLFQIVSTFLYFIVLFTLSKDAPRLLNLTQQNITEGETVIVRCEVIEGNPNSTNVYWTRVGDSTFQENSATLQLLKIQRNSSGSYKCTAENMFNDGSKGTHSQIMFINVLCEIFLFLRTILRIYD